MCAATSRFAPLTNSTQFHDLQTPNGVLALAQELAHHSVRVSAFLLGNDFGKPDADEQVTWMVRTVQLAHQLNVPAVRVDAVVSGWEALGLEGAVRLFTDFIKKVLRPEFLHAVLESVGSPRLGLTLDTGNFYWFGHPLSEVYAIMRQFGGAVKHTHIKNIAYPPELREQPRPKYGKFVCPIPDGDIDHRVVVGILKEAGYTWDLCAEDESLGKFAPSERPQVLKRDVEHLQELVANF